MKVKVLLQSAVSEARPNSRISLFKNSLLVELLEQK
jgi:hypothetical protein